MGIIKTQSLCGQRSRKCFKWEWIFHNWRPHFSADIKLMFLIHYLSHLEGKYHRKVSNLYINLVSMATIGIFCYSERPLNNWFAERHWISLRFVEEVEKRPQTSNPRDVALLPSTHWLCKHKEHRCWVISCRVYSVIVISFSSNQGELLLFPPLSHAPQTQLSSVSLILFIITWFLSALPLLPIPHGSTCYSQLQAIDWSQLHQ